MINRTEKRLKNGKIKKFKENRKKTLEIDMKITVYILTNVTV